MQLTKLKTHNYSFIPDISTEKIYNHPISTTSSTDNSCYNSDSSSPASPTPSLDSVGSLEDCDVFRSPCLVKSRRQKRSRPSPSSSLQHQCNGGESGILNKRTRNTGNNSFSSMTYGIHLPSYNNNNNNNSNNNNNNNNSNFDMYNLAPLPSPDFDDLVDCMLTEEALSQIDITNYLPAL